MLVFIDESGHPTPNDAATKPVLVAVCIPEREVRNVSRRVYAAKRSTAGRPEMELKAVNIFNRHTLRRKPEYWVLAREVLEICLNTPITVFGISMDRPTGPVPDDDDDSVLPAQFRFLLGRVNQFCDEEDDRATILFDDPGQRRLARKFSSYLFRSGEGQSMSRIADAPYFVDSKITTGIQIADLIAGAFRIWEENELYRYVPPDPYFEEIATLHRLTQRMTRNLFMPDGTELYGIYHMPERWHYRNDQEGT